MEPIVQHVFHIVMNVMLQTNVQLVLILIIGFLLQHLVNNVLLDNIMIVAHYRVEIVALIALFAHQILFAQIVQKDIGLIILHVQHACQIVMNVMLQINVLLVLILIIGLFLQHLVNNVLLDNFIMTLKEHARIVALIALFAHQILFAQIVQKDIGLIILLVQHVCQIVMNVMLQINVQLALILIIGFLLQALVDNVLLDNIIIVAHHPVKIVALIALFAHQILFAQIVQKDIGLIILLVQPAQEVVLLVLQRLFALHAPLDIG